MPIMCEGWRGLDFFTGSEKFQNPEALCEPGKKCIENTFNGVTVGHEFVESFTRRK